MNVADGADGKDEFVGDGRSGAHAAGSPADVAHPIRTGVPGRAPTFLTVVAIEAGDGFLHSAPFFRPADNHVIAGHRRRAPTLTNRRAPFDGRAIGRPGTHQTCLRRSPVSAWTLKLRPIRPGDSGGI